MGAIDIVNLNYSPSLLYIGINSHREGTFRFFVLKNFFSNRIGGGGRCGDKALIHPSISQ
jgi:hypothetical protein